MSCWDSSDPWRLASDLVCLTARLDLSSVLFIATANSLETISDPLYDRMEAIQLSGYVVESITSDQRSRSMSNLCIL